MPRHTPSTGTAAASSTSRPTAKSPGSVGAAGAGGEHHVAEAGQQVVERHLVVLDDRRQDAGDGGDEMHEVPRVGVVVVHDHDAGTRHGGDATATAMSPDGRGKGVSGERRRRLTPPARSAGSRRAGRSP